MTRRVSTDLAAIRYRVKGLEAKSIVDVMADTIQVPAALIMHLRGDSIEVLGSSHTSENPYTPGHSELVWNSGLYCERVFRTGAPLLVNNALLDAEWNDNPDVKLRMISYLGLPISWPGQEPFGTICVLGQPRKRV
ncbi:GAF domain-containing protein [Paraburkholderia sp. Cpub6]|uniref:GAF domain-containing protein n=1 Tax=Paraburkholderia sp. Cpub6 TaxID=2723094 RepID=UPI0017B67640|nr:GAF domain-containing protein [Paraburkholderia sp. Cpub6]